MKKRTGNSWRSRQGKYYEAELSDSFKAFRSQHRDFFFHRLADTFSYIKVPNLILPKQPADFLALYKGQAFLIEAKSTKEVSFNMENLANHQRDGLLDFERAGGKSYIFFLFMGTPSRSFASPIKLYCEAEQKALQLDRKSVPLKMIEECSIELKRIPRVGWDASQIFTE